MKITRAGTLPTKRANSDWFTGEVWQDPVAEAPAPARARALIVTFAPGARTAWHTHPLGQTLHILRGVGYVGRRGEAPQEVRGGDSIWFEPGEEHWHGAAPKTGMVHLAIQEADETGKMADWLEKVSDSDYLARS